MTFNRISLEDQDKDKQYFSKKKKTEKHLQNPKWLLLKHLQNQPSLSLLSFPAQWFTKPPHQLKSGLVNLTIQQT